SSGSLRSVSAGLQRPPSRRWSFVERRASGYACVWPAHSSHPWSSERTLPRWAGSSQTEAAPTSGPGWPGVPAPFSASRRAFWSFAGSFCSRRSDSPWDRCGLLGLPVPRRTSDSLAVPPKRAICAYPRPRSGSSDLRLGELRRAVRRSPTLFHAAKTIESSLLGVRRAIWKAGRTTAVDRYLASHSPKKLQLGTGEFPTPGWLNTDIDPTLARTSQP